MNIQSATTSSFTLTTWQKTQAAMLYHFASLDYLKGLHRMVSQLMNGVVDPLLDLAKAQNRDSVLVDARWGTRDTSANWASNAWPFLKDFQQSLAKDIAGRAFERYKITGTNQCLRGIDEYSMQWTTPEEEERFNEAVRAIERYAGKIDDTLDDYHNSRWSDFGFAYDYKEFAAQFLQIPKFHIRTDVQAETGKTPPRTGVYVAQDDPHAALQFAWTGGGGGKLRPSSTFNELGLRALNVVGRKDLWFNEDKMFAFVQANINDPALRNDSCFRHSQSPELAPSLVARNAFTERPCKWYFVEMINGESEDIGIVSNSDIPAMPTQNRLRVEGGQPCPQAGYWFTPAQVNSRRHFKEGEKMPIAGSDYGDTIWQWDPNQD
jgi:hypothetical protein